MPSHRIEDQLEALKSLRTNGATSEVIPMLRNALNDRVNVVVAKAAQIAAEMDLKALVPDLAAAFERLFVQPQKTDPQCWGKNAISKALKDLSYDQSNLFLRGLRHVQMEPVWGGAADTAITLRATCCLALAPCRDLPREAILRALLDALTDDLSEAPERSAPVRIDAVRALEQMGGEEVILMLRLKAKVGDVAPAVTGQVFESLLQLEGTKGVDFVASFLGRYSEEVKEEAALALGASRISRAVDVLKEAWPQRGGTRAGETILRAISSSRTGAAIDFLLGVLRQGRPREAMEALRALALHATSEEIRLRVVEAAAERTEPAIQAELHARF